MGLLNSDLINTFMCRSNDGWRLLQQSRTNDFGVARDVDEGTINKALWVLFVCLLYAFPSDFEARYLLPVSSSPNTCCRCVVSKVSSFLHTCIILHPSFSVVFRGNMLTDDIYAVGEEP